MTSRLNLLLVVVLYIGAPVGGKINVDELRCIVCKTTIYEMGKAVKKIDPTRVVDVGGYRIDSSGNYIHNTVPQAQSEIHLSEIAEEICPKMDDYIRATWKKNGTLMLMKFLDEDGKMNPAMSEVDIVQDDDLNKSLKYYCEEVMEEQEERIIKYFQEGVVNIQEKICATDSSFCKSTQGPQNKSEL